jgi:UV DNA damage endonuclease
LLKILKWNKENGISFFRISSEMFPWASEYALESLPDFEEILLTLKSCGDFSKDNNIRLTYHPGPFNKLCSPKENVVLNTLKDLNHHAEVFDLMGLSKTHYNKINIHVGGAYGDKLSAVDRFCLNFDRLSESAKSRLTVENDDRPSLFSTKELLDMVFPKINIPIVHDFHHHHFRNDGESQEEALLMAISTWGSIKPVVHYSESRTIEFPNAKDHAHSDFIYSKIDLFNNDVDVMVESKKKELSILKYKKDHASS